MTIDLGDLQARIADKTAELSSLRPLSAAALAELRKPYDIELTFTSNAIEGNTLTLRETAEVIEHGITVGGKPLRDHLEAVDHHAAVQWMYELAQGSIALDEAIVCAVRPQDRAAYLEALETGSATSDLAPFQRLMHERLDATLDEYLTALREALR